MERCLSCMKEYNIDDTTKGKGNTCPFCGYEKGTPTEEIYHLNPGTILRDRYILGVVIGFGGFGITYKAWDKSLGTVVAVKEYYPTGIVQRVIGENNVSIYAKAKKKEFFAGMTRFMSEAKNMARFSDVPNIVHVNNYFEENNTAYIVMEYLDGVTLKHVLEEKGKLSDEETLEIMFPVMDALHALHQENILHRDISPDNIFICNNGQIKLIDFGAARFSDIENEMTRSIILKAGYAPVEQYRAKSKQGPFTDIYAVGATIYRCITGEAPDESVSRALEDELKAPNELDANIPKYISSAVMKSMAINAELRFGSIPQFKKALEQKKVVKSDKQVVKGRKIRRAIVILFFFILIAIGGFGAYKYYEYKSNRIVLEKSTITIWVPVEVTEDTKDADIEAAKQRIHTMSEKFLKDQPNVTLDVTAIPAEEYNQRLEDAAEVGNLPTLFLSDGVSDSILNESLVLDDVYEYLDVSNCYFLEDYKSEISAGRQFPTAFNAPVVYVRRTNGIDMNTVLINQFEQLDSDGSKGYYIDSNYYAMSLNSIGGNFYFGKDNIIDENTVNMLSDMMEEYNSKNYEFDAEKTEKDITLELFENGEITYYLASFNDNDYMRQEMPGLYAFRPMNSEQIQGEFVMMWSIGNSASDDQALAAKIWFNYILAERPQKTMFISENMLPLNKTIYSSINEIDESFSIMADYTDNMVFDYGKQDYIDRREKALYQNVIVGDEELDSWVNEQ